MIVVNPKTTLIGRAVFYDLFFSSLSFKLLFSLVWFLGVASILIIILAILGQNPTSLIDDWLGSGSNGGNYLSFSLSFAGIFLAYLPLRAFFQQKVKYPKPQTLADYRQKLTVNESTNLFSIFSFGLAKATYKPFSRKTGPSSVDLFLAILKAKELNFILVRLGIGRQLILEKAKTAKIKTSVNDILATALDVAIVEEHHQIEVGDVFIALCKTEPFFQNLINEFHLEVSDVAQVVYWQTNLIRKMLVGRRFLDPKRFHLSGGIGRDWAFGFTPLLKQYGRNLTDLVNQGGLNLEIIGHEKEIAEIEEVLLSVNGGNAILVGETGVGKRTTILGLAKKIAEGKSDGRLSFKHLIEVDVEMLISGCTTEGEIAARLNQLLNEAIRAGNIILFIDNFENLLATKSAVGKMDAVSVLVPFLESSSLNLIGACDVASYNQFVISHPSLVERLNRVSIDEPNEHNTIRILEDTVSLIEYETGSIISYEAIKESVKLANKYILNLPNPEKSINLLSGASAHTSHERGKTVVAAKDIRAYVESKYDVPLTQAEGKEKQILLNLEKELHKSVIGQDEAIKAISDALRRARAGITEGKKPIGSFLFLGPTGVGKTETAKALARVYFGAEERMIRFDMSEYQNREDIYRFIGSNLQGENNAGNLVTAVRESPFSLILFDEIEKANKDILDLFLQILDEGHLTDGLGRKVSFSNTIIICTSNAGANLIREAVKTGAQYEKSKKSLLDHLQNEGIFRPEFLNRFTQVTLFSSLAENELALVAKLMIEELKTSVWKNRRIKLEVVEEAIARLAKLGFDPEMGARLMARTISEKVENLLAKKILSNELKEGDQFTVTLEMVG